MITIISMINSNLPFTHICLMLFKWTLLV